MPERVCSFLGEGKKTGQLLLWDFIFTLGIPTTLWVCLSNINAISVAVKLCRGNTISPKIVSLSDRISRDILSLYEIVSLYSLCERAHIAKLGDNSYL